MKQLERTTGKAMRMLRSGTAPLCLLGLIAMFQIEAPALAFAAPPAAMAAPALPTSTELVATEDLSPQAAKRARKARCAECGVIASMKSVESEDKAALGATDGVKRPMVYEFTVRFADGSHRVISDANPAAWKLGERMSII